MNKILLILISFSLCSNSIFSQENDDLYYSPTNEIVKIDLKSIPKGTWKIIIITDKNQADNYLYVGEFLLEENYQFNTNKEFYSISTVPRLSDRKNFLYSLNFFAKDSMITLTGNHAFAIDLSKIASDYNFERTENRGQTGSIYWQSFKIMFEFGQRLAASYKMKFINE